MTSSLRSDGPVFLVGTGRCGSTIIDSVLAMHPEFGWQSSWIDVFPRWPGLAFVNRAWGLPGMDRFRTTRFFPTPVEPYDAWRVHLTRFSDESTDPEVIAELSRVLVPFIDRILGYHGARRYLGKLVGRPVKIGQLAEVFPDATFVHILRELKPTLASLMQVEFYQDWEPFDRWPWEEVPAEYLDFYEESGRSEVVGTAIRLKLNLDEVERQLEQIDSGRQTTVGYAAFCRDPVPELRHVAEAIGISIDERFAERVRAREIYGGADEKWRRYFSEDQVALLDEFEARFGYGSAGGSALQPSRGESA